MPKEIVAGSAVEGEGGFHVKVGWTANRDVQIGVECDGGRSLFWQLLSGYGRDGGKLVELGQLVRRLVFDAAEIGPDDAGKGRAPLPDEVVGELLLNALDTFVVMPYSGVWADLDRHGCNRLIRNVRKARDSAYGRDE